MVAASRVLLARPVVAGHPAGAEGQGGGDGRPYRVSQADRPAVFGLVLPCNGPAWGMPGGERGARRASRGGYLVFDGIECKCENTKVSCMDCNLIRLHQTQTAAGLLRRPPVISKG